MNLPWIKALPLLLLALLVTGCATKVPALSSITMTLVDLKTEGGRPVASVRYLNESVISIGLAATRHKIYVNGNLVGEAVHSDAVGLASALPVVIHIPLTSPAGATLPPPGSMISYRMENRLTVLVGDRRVNSDSDSAGSVTLP
jgi:hypothetical protein